MDETKLDNPNLRIIHFGREFSITDVHLDAIRQRTALAMNLQELSLGHSDTGCGGAVTDEGIINLAKACPNLTVVCLDAVTNLTDAVLQGICQSCPSLTNLSIMGHDKRDGEIKGSSLKFLADHPEVAPNLKELVLYDQPHYTFSKIMKELTTKRKGLVIKTGKTATSDWGRDEAYVTVNGETHESRR